MNDWRTVKLADLGPITTGKTPPSSKPDSFGGSIPFVTPSDMLAGRYIWSTSRSLTEAGLRTVSKRMLPAGCVLVSCIGSDMGKTYIASRSCFTNQQINSIEVTDRGAHPLYVYYNLSGRKAELQQLASGSSAQPILNKSNFSQISLELPPIAEQTAIADLLSSLDDKIELNRRTNETLEAMAQAIFRDWFVDFGPTRRKLDGATDAIEIMGGLVNDPDRAQELAALFPARLGDDGLPEGWEAVAASTLIEFNPSEPLKKGTVTPYSDMGSLPTTGSLAEPPVERAFGSGMRFRNGDALLARITPCLENGKAAYVDFLPNDAVGWGSTEFIVLRARSPLPPPFAYFLVRHAEFRDRAIRSMTGTSGRQRVQAESLTSFLLPRAPAEVFKAFGSLVEPLFDLISTNGRQNRTLAATRDLLLPKLMSGEIRLREAERKIEAVA